MKFTPAQVRAIVGVSEQTLRYWKPLFPPLREKRGQAPCYTHGDLLALLVIDRLVHKLHIDIRFIATHSEKLFASCHHSQWLRIADMTVLVSENTIEVQPRDSLSSCDFSNPCVVVSLSAMLEELRLTLLAQDPSSQLDLNFPPLAVAPVSKRYHS
jgi:DNA-binding transcriptional MerR regulator